MGKRQMKTLGFLMALTWPLAAQGPAFDSSGNGMLNGTYSFRHVLYVVTTVPDANGIVGDLGETVVLYGNISFDGQGNYSISNGIVWDSDVGMADGLSCYLAQGICATGVPVPGTYSISASGFGYITNPITEDLIFGLVSANGVFAGSSTETTLAYNDLFIGAPASATAPANSLFQGNYSVAGFLANADPTMTQDVFFPVTADGAGNLGTVNITGYIGGGGASTLSQSSSGVTYSFSGGDANINFPTDPTATFFQAPECVYFTPDGNFFFGGSTSGGFDMIVGVRSTPGSAGLSGLYYQAGIAQNASQLTNGNADLSAFYGSFVAAGDGNIIAHQRLADIDLGVSGVTFADSFTAPGTGSYLNAAGTEQEAVGAGGAIRVSQEIWPSLGVSVAFQAPTFTPSGAVYLNPTGILNAASFAPFTAGVSDGEMVTLYGAGLASTTAMASSAPYAPTLGGVQVSVNGVSAPVAAVSPTAISVIVPFETSSPLAQFQVMNNGANSNVVTMVVNQTTPGVFTLTGDGLLDGMILHAADGSEVSPSSPAQPGESVIVYVTGLGSVAPPVADGAAAPANPLSMTTDTINAAIGGTAATVSSANLAPGMAGVYQVTLQIPSGLPAGENTLDISGPDSSAMQATIAVGGSAGSARRPAALRSHAQRPFVDRKPPCLPGPGKACRAQ
jgi:uncharacterized protein (TIGR03437 family)